jgi:uncharacterized protein
VIFGWIFIMRPAVAHLDHEPKSAVAAPRNVRAALYEGLPMLLAITCGLGFEAGMAVFAPGLPFELGIVTALLLAIACSLIQNHVGPSFIAGVFVDRELYKLVGLVVSVLVFKDLLQASGAVQQLARVASGQGALFALTLSLPFLVGFISGITVAFVGATFPILIGVLGSLGPAAVDTNQLLAYMTLGLFSGFAGVMVSPLHVCFILSCQFFETDIGAAWRRLVMPSFLLLLSGVAWFFALTRLILA